VRIFINEKIKSHGGNVINAIHKKEELSYKNSILDATNKQMKQL
jgi:hypothetical protein